MKNNSFETLIGAIVVAVALGFVWFAYENTDANARGGYEIQAVFSSADGISPGTDVRLHGIKIGSVSALELDRKTYNAVLHIALHSDVQVPDDSSIKVTSSGLLGGSYLSLQPGGSDAMLKPGGQILDTQGSVDLMALIGRAIYGNTGSK